MAIGVVMELITQLALAIGADERTADVASLLVIVFAAYSRMRSFPPDEESQKWARTAPGAAGAIVGASVAVLLVGWFFLTEEDAGQAAGASVLAIVLSVVCAFMCRRGYARQGTG